MREPWMKKFVKVSRKLSSEDAPVWWDGFRNVVARGESSHDDDNPYLQDGEEHLHAEYKAGAKAAESLVRCVAKNHRRQKKL